MRYTSPLVITRTTLKMCDSHPTVMEVIEPWFSQIRTGSKRIEGRKNSPTWRGLDVGQKLTIKNPVSKESFPVEITKLTVYPTLQDFLIQEGVKNVLPGFNYDGAVELYNVLLNEEEITTYGMLAISIKVCSN